MRTRESLLCTAAVIVSINLIAFSRWRHHRSLWQFGQLLGWFRRKNCQPAQLALFLYILLPLRLRRGTRGKEYTETGA